MATPEDTDVPAQPSNVEKLADFILAHIETGVVDENGLDDERARDLAHAIFSEFLRTDVEATSLFARPGVDADTLAPFAIVTWGPMVGRLAPVELRSIAAGFLESAETAEIEATFCSWLMEGQHGTREGTVEILHSFRRYRAELEARE